MQRRLHLVRAACLGAPPRSERRHPSTRDLPAVREGRFLDPPYAAWVSGPLDIDAAEQLRDSLEEAGLLPDSGITPAHDLRP